MIEAPRIGFLRSGPRDSIADVAGVTVSHVTLAEGGVQTGVTVVRPHAGDAYRAPVAAAAVVINGFGKTTGLLQLNELGMLASPIALTNTRRRPLRSPTCSRCCRSAVRGPGDGRVDIADDARCRACAERPVGNVGAMLR